LLSFAFDPFRFACVNQAATNLAPKQDRKAEINAMLDTTRQQVEHTASAIIGCDGAGNGGRNR
jgi:hypothetical protein